MSDEPDDLDSVIAEMLEDPDGRFAFERALQAFAWGATNRGKGFPRWRVIGKSMR